MMPEDPTTHPCWRSGKASAKYRASGEKAVTSLVVQEAPPLLVAVMLPVTSRAQTWTPGRAAWVEEPEPIRRLPRWGGFLDDVGQFDPGFFGVAPREAAVMDGCNEFQLLFRIFLPMNWGVTTALGIITFIGAWNNFLWPFLAATDEKMMTVTVGIRAVQDSFGVAYARLLAGAVLAGLPVAAAYLLFQRRVTQAITLSAGIKG